MVYKKERKVIWINTQHFNIGFLFIKAILKIFLKQKVQKVKINQIWGWQISLYGIYYIKMENYRDK